MLPRPRAPIYAAAAGTPGGTGGAGFPKTAQPTLLRGCGAGPRGPAERTLNPPGLKGLGFQEGDLMGSPCDTAVSQRWSRPARPPRQVARSCASRKARLPATEAEKPFVSQDAGGRGGVGEQQWEQLCPPLPAVVTPQCTEGHSLLGFSGSQAASSSAHRKSGH